MTAIIGEYIQLQTYKEKPYVTLHIDFPEERADEIIRAIGWKKSGQSIYLGVTLMDKDSIKDYLESSSSKNSNSSVVKESLPTQNEKSEGQTMLARAHLLCGEREFLNWVAELGWDESRPDYNAVEYIYDTCDIVSRSQLVNDKAAQEKFRQLDKQFKDWQWEQRHADNLSRE